MTNQRTSHQQKSIDERREYMATTIRGIAPTLESELISDESTDVSAITDKGYVGPLTRTKEEPWLRHKLRENLFQAIITIVSTVLICFLSWFAYQLYTINREVGELEIKINTLESSNERLSHDIEKAEVRVQREIQKNSERTLNLENRLNTILTNIHSSQSK